MSTTVDRRVVDMEFNNQRFERNVATTMSSLDKLKQKLDLSGAAKGLEEVGNNAKRINLSGLATAAETITVKFSHMQMTVQHVLNNMVDYAIRTGKRMASALTVDPIKTGLSEYETQINSVQTILANTESKGTTLGQVNAALDELNTYADKTIYNFTEMTRNIGTFTAAGVDLKTSVSAIQGIANLAAVSGSTSQQASTAMYQLSQALSSGTVKLMDWNSVVNAGMGGQVFQDALKETARVHGVSIDAMIKKRGSFRETLQDEWLTADILTETLEHFTMAAEKGTEEYENYKKSLMDDGYSASQAEAIIKLANTATSAATEVKTATQLWDTLKETAQSGWTQTWEIIMGDFGEAKELFSGIYNTISPMLEATAKARNELLSGGLSSGWKQLLGQGISDEEGYKEMFQSVAKEHGIAFDQMIEKEGSFEAALKKGLQNGVALDNDKYDGSVKGGIKPSQVLTTDMLTDSVSRMAEKMRNMSAEERAAAGYTEEHVKQIEALDKGLKDGSISMEEFRDKMLKPSGRENIIEGLKNVLDGVLNIMKPVKEAFANIFPPMTAEKLYSFTESFRKLTDRFKGFTESHGEQIRTTFEGIFSVVDIGWTFVKRLAGGVRDLLGHFKGFGSGVLDTTASIGEWLIGLRDTVKETDIFGVAIDKVVEFLGKVIDKIKEFGGKVKSAFTLPGVEGFLDIMRGIWDVILKIGSKAGKIFAPIGKAIANLFKGGRIADLIHDGLFAGLLVGGIKTVNSLKSIFDDFSGEGGLMDGIKETLDSVKGCFEAYQNSLNAETLKKIAVAIAILAGSIFVISSIDGNALDRSLGAIGIMFAELMGSFAIFTKASSGSKDLVKATGAIMGLASAVLVLSLAMKIMSSMSWDEIGRGIVGTVAGLGALVGAFRLMGKDGLFEDSKSPAKAIKKLAISLVILAAGMKIMASMSWNELARGITGTVVGLGALVGAVNLLPKDAGLRSLGMIGLATAMVILGGALKIMGSMSWGEIGKGLAVMGGALLELVVALNLMVAALPGAAALIVAAGALVILGGALKIMGSMSWGEIGKGLVAIGGSLLILAVGLTLMVAALPGAAALVVVAGALAILTPVLMAMGSMSWESIGKALLTLAGALTVIGVAGLLLTPVIPTLLGLGGAIALLGVGVLAAGAGLVLLSAGITALSVALSAGTAAIVAGLSAIILGLVDLIPQVLLRLGDAILALCDVIAECTPAIVETLFILISELCTQLATYVPLIAGALFDLLIGAIDVLAERMPELVDSVVNLISAFFTSISDAVSGMDSSGLVKAIIGFGLVSALAAVFSAIAGLIPSAMVGVLGLGALVAEIALVVAAIGALAQIPGLSWLIEEGGDFLQTVGTAIGQFVGGIIGGIAEGATSTLPQVGTNLSDFMTNLEPFITGMQSIDSAVIDNASALAKAILILTAADLLSGITSFFSGGDTLADFGKEIGEFGIAMKDYSATVAGLDIDAVNTSVTAGQALMDMASKIPSDGLFGGDGIDDFGENLVDFGECIKEYADEVAGIDGSTIKASVEAAAGLFDLAGKIPKDGWLGTDGIDDFGDNIAEFGKELADYSETVSEVNFGAISNSISYIERLMTMVNNLVGIDDGGVKTFKKAIKDLANTNFADFVTTFSSGGAELVAAGKEMFANIINGIMSVKPRFVATARTVANIGLETLRSRYAEFKVAGIEIISNFINGILRGKPRVLAGFRSAITTSLTTVRGYYSSMYNAGGYLVTGFANGISANSYKAKAKAKAMAQAAVNAAETELDINSPSRVGYGIGNFFGIGFVNAIGDSTKNAYDASKNMADSAKSGLKTAFERIRQIASGEIEISPTIRPILDLTNVRSGASSLDSMFSLRPSMDVLAHVGAVSSMMNNRNLSNGSDEIVAAIKSLAKDLSKVGGTTNNFGGITYSNGDEVDDAVRTLVRAVTIGGRS